MVTHILLELTPTNQSRLCSGQRIGPDGEQAACAALAHLVLDAILVVFGPIGSKAVTKRALGTVGADGMDGGI